MTIPHRTAKNIEILSNRLLRRSVGSRRPPGTTLRIFLLALVSLLIIVPLARLAVVTVADTGFDMWREAFLGEIAPNLFWIPLKNSLLVGAIAILGTLVLGGFMAWLVVMTDVPGRYLLGALAAIPYVVPSFAVALAWQTVFRNDLLGGRVGLLQELGLNIPDWLAWGLIPTSVTLIVHYFSLPFLLISAALASVNTELIEAGEMTGASRSRVLRDITLPIILPAVASSALLVFAVGVSNFAAPALLGLPVRFETLSTRIFGMIRIGQLERGYMLTIILILIAALLLWGNSRQLRNPS